MQSLDFSANLYISCLASVVSQHSAFPVKDEDQSHIWMDSINTTVHTFVKPCSYSKPYIQMALPACLLTDHYTKPGLYGTSGQTGLVRLWTGR